MPPEIAAAVHARITSIDAGLDTVTRRYLHALTPERWAIEWNLPVWLGQAFGIDRAVVEALVRANVLGLLAVRAEDDLADGEVVSDAIPATRALATGAMDEALAIYRSLFDAGSPVWSVVSSSLAAWRAGSEDLAVRGAPIRITGYAGCLVANRLDAWPALQASLDHAIRGLVLYDQFCDWEADVTAGRWNAFVALASPARQAEESPDRTRAAVLTAMLTTDVVERQFSLAVGEARAAATAARELGIDGLARFLETWSLETSAQGTSIARHYTAIGNQAAGLFGSPGQATAAVGGRT